VVTYNRETESGVAAAERALAVLAAFDEDAPVLTLAKLAARTGMGKSTLLRLLVSLVRTGFIERHDDGTYRIGSQAWRVGSLFTLDLSLEKILLPIMEQLAARTKESVAFYVRLEGVTPPTRICLLRVSAQDESCICITLGIGCRWIGELGGEWFAPSPISRIAKTM